MKIVAEISARDHAIKKSSSSIKRDLNTQSDVTSTAASNAEVSSPAPVSAPVNAIFEPLREVSQRRRKQAEPLENADSEYMASEPLNPMAGGKFERIIPKINLRSASNRWPVSSIQQVTAPVAAPRHLESAATATKASTAIPISAEPTLPPAKGLKSFVSKVKGSTPDSE